MRIVYIILISVLLLLSCFPDNLYVKSPYIEEETTVGFGCLQSKITIEGQSVNYNSEIYHFPIYCSYGKILDNGMRMGLDIMFPSYAVANLKIGSPIIHGFFSTFSIGFYGYLPYSSNLYLGRKVNEHMTFYTGIAVPQIYKIIYQFSNDNNKDMRVTIPIGIGIKISPRLEYLSEIILPLFNESKFSNKPNIAHSRFGSAIFWHLR